MVLREKERATTKMGGYVRAAAGPGYYRPLSRAQMMAMRACATCGDLHYKGSAIVRQNTIDSLLRLGIFEHVEIASADGYESGRKTRAAVKLTLLGERLLSPSGKAAP